MIRHPLPFPDEPPSVHPPRSRMRLTRKQVISLGFLTLLLLSGVIGGWAASSVLFHAQAASSTPSYTLNQFLQQGKPYQTFDGLHVPPASYTSSAGTKKVTAPVTPLPTSEPAKMTAVSQVLSSSSQTGQASTTSSGSPAVNLIGSDGQGQRMEVHIPAGALDSSKATTVNGTAPQGALTITLSQVHGHSSTATNELGSFQLHITDAQGNVLQGVLLRSPATFIVHYRTNELSDLGLSPDKLYLIEQNASSTTTTTTATTKTATEIGQALSSTAIALQDHPATSTLTAQSSTLSVSPLVVTGSNPIQNPPKANFASVQGNGGQLSYSYPLVVAPGPQGTVPDLRAVYSSEATNERRAPTTPANNVGDGWELALGSVSAEKYPDGSIWYSISGVDNVSDRLIPDTSGTNFATQHLSYLKVTKVTSGVTGQPCFDAWGTEGNFYEFGCTSDSLQYYIDSTGNRVNYRFDLDRMIPTNEGPGTNGRNLTASYVQDMETSGGHTWVRDAALKQITYGNGINRIGTVDFFYNGPTTYSDPNSHIQYVTQYTSTYETNCHLPATGTTPQRCDDPLDRSGGMADPDVMSTFSLQSVKTYVGDNSSTSHLDYSYAFTYQETAFGNCPSADSTLSTAYCAGNHLLSSITPTVYQNGTGFALPGVTFGYSGGRTDKYDDSSQSYHMENSWNYLTSYHDHSNGVGATSITYHTAYNNSHGTPNTAGDNRYDTLYCAYNPTNCNSGTAFYPMDDKMWTMQVVTIITATGKDSSASSLSPASTTYDYWLTQTQGSCPADSATPPNSDCVGFGWIPNSGKDWQSYYHGIFTGFGTVLVISPAGDLTVQHYASTWGWDSSSADPRNYLAGKMVDEEVYQGQYINDANLLTKTTNSYGGQNSTKAACASTSTYPSTLYQPCETVLLNSRTTTYEKTGSGNTNAPWVQKDYTYDDYTTGGGLGDYHQSPATGSYHNLQQVVTSGSNIPSRTQHFTYYTTNTTSGGTTYYNVHSVAHSDIVDSSSHMWQCKDTTYDAGVAGGVPTPSAGWPTIVTAYTNCANQSATAFKTYNGYNTYGDLVASVDAMGVATPSLYASNGCTLTTTPQFFPTSSWSATRYTECSTYDSTSSLPTDSWNVLGQHSSTAYDGTQGLLPITQTDANSQVTNILYSYDASGNKTAQMKLPNEAGSYTSQATVTSLCIDSSTLPCVEVDSNSSLYSSVKARTFYDSLGRKVESQTPGPDGTHTTVSFTVYNDQTHSVFSSLPFVVNSRTTWLDPNGATDDTGATPGGTSVVLDPLDRTISTTDALSNQSNASYGLGSVSGDSNTYATTKVADANKHVQFSYTDALDETRYVQQDSGLSTGTLTANTLKAYQYNVLENLTSLVVTDLAPQSGQTVTSVTTQMQYNDVGEVTTLIDPDRGTFTYTYDADGRPLTEVSGTRTTGTSYDLLGRARCVQDAAPTTDGSGNCSSGSHPLVQNTYDTSFLGTAGTTDFPIGQLTQSIATTYYDPNNYSNKSTVTEQFQHDQRGQDVASNLQIGVPSSWNVTTTLPTYKQTQSYNDALQPTTTQTTVGASTGYTFSQAYDSTTGVLTGISNNSTAVANLATLSYNPQALVSDINFQTTTASALATDHFSFDGNLRPVSATATWQSGSGSIGSIFSSTESYDAVGNVTNRSVTHAAIPGQTGSGGSETQNFCYDEQNRLVWAGNSGTQPSAGNGTCGSSTLSNTLGAAAYSTNFAYTHLGQLWQGPVNGRGPAQQYLYCDTTHPHQLKGLYPTGTTCANPTGATYQSQYDAWGNVTSRTYNGTTATLSYDTLDHLTQWNAGSSSQQWYAYDASGNRVALRSTTASGTSITTYAFGLEEHTYDASGNNTNNTYYYLLDGILIGALMGMGTLATQFFLTDTLGSVLATFSATAGSAALQGNQVFSPYGNALYNKGSMGTSKGFTGQYNDATGLDYYNARYYDPAAGVFLSADDIQGNIQGMNPYSYVAGNPETYNDPTGEFFFNPGTGQGARLTSGTAGGPPKITIFQYQAPATVVTGTTKKSPVTHVPVKSSSPSPFDKFIKWVTNVVNGASAIQAAGSGFLHAHTQALRNYATNAPGNPSQASKTPMYKFIRWATGGVGKMTVDRRASKAAQVADSIDGAAEALPVIGIGLLVFGSIIDGVTSGQAYYQTHPKRGVAAAVGVGVLHGVLSGTNSFVYGTVGELAGAGLGMFAFGAEEVTVPLGAAVGGAAGGYWGAVAGDTAADNFVNSIQ